MRPRADASVRVGMASIDRDGVAPWARMRGVRFSFLLVAATTTGGCLRVPPPPPATPISDPANLAARIAATTSGLRPAVLVRALAAYDCAASRREVGGNVFALIDYELPSTRERLWLVDLAAARALRRELVAHGKGSGDDVADRFSNESTSHQSSVGLFRVLAPYQGKHGLSLRLRGLEPGFNDNAERRSIVIHGADYVSQEFIARHGRLGRSWGCPALPLAAHRDVIDTLENGSALFIWGNDSAWQQRSRYLHCGATAD